MQKIQDAQSDLDFSAVEGSIDAALYDAADDSLRRIIQHDSLPRLYSQLGLDVDDD